MRIANAKPGAGRKRYSLANPTFADRAHATAYIGGPTRLEETNTLKNVVRREFRVAIHPNDYLALSLP